VVHRDIKPENVLINEAGDIRLIDFSLSQTWFDRLLQFGRRTEGTPLYMAPEQVRGEKCDPRTDIYGCGALAYELFTKRPPFLAPSEAKVLEAHVRETPRPMSSFVRGIPAEIDRLVLRMLAKKRDDRPANFGEVIAELVRIDRTGVAAVA
jgi:serine/threonine-protein kinase